MSEQFTIIFSDTDKNSISLKISNDIQIFNKHVLNVSEALFKFKGKLIILYLILLERK